MLIMVIINFFATFRILDLCSESQLPSARARSLALCESLYSDDEKNHRSHPHLGLMVYLLADTAEAEEQSEKRNEAISRSKQVC